ncbi:hypothetical protein K2Z84_07255, partial [Candidatus Binatia bacterium]|nr:hypothetical protein [Candidatus Binatia bacterium]
MPSNRGSVAARRTRAARALLVVLLAFASPRGAAAQDPGWPREVVKDGVRLVYYQPQADDWKDFTDLDFRLAVSVTPKGGKPVLGVVQVHARTDVDVHARTVLLHDLTITDTSFPSLDPPAAAKLNALVRSLLAPDKTVTISLDRLVASVEKPAVPAAVQLDDAPPPIYVSYGPAILVQIEGEPVFAKAAGGDLEFVVNTNWPLFRDAASRALWLFDGQQWLTAAKLDGPWTASRALPKSVAALAKDPQWKALAKAIPAPPTRPAPTVFVSDRPAEVVVFAGQPLYAPIPDTQLVYAKNTDTPLFVYSPASTYYLLIAGRWFRATDLKGPWTFATGDLPPDFAAIPADSPMGFVRASVPGTDEAKDAVLLAQVPTTATIEDPAALAKQASATYDGPPKFEPIAGTSLAYASNTPEKVIKVGDLYYLCLQGVWFVSTTPQGPWQTAPSVPKEIYAIPPSSPVYNVTYVTQVTTPSGAVQSSYTAGYLGAFIMGAAVGAVVASGTGYYHPPYVYYPPVGYPVYRPYPVPYGAYGVAAPIYVPRTGAYGVGAAAYGPYGGVAAASTYNPYTGTYARGATAYGPYGSASAGQAYNPYTGTYARGATASGPGGTRTAAGVYNPYTGAGAATRQGSSPYAQWGSSVVTNGSQTAYAQHASNARGSVGSVQTSSGGKAVGASTAYGSGGVAKTSSGDVYAGKDGNVYKNTGSGWEKYDDGGWSNVNAPSRSQSSAQGTPSAATAGSAASTRGSGGTARTATSSTRAASAQAGASTRSRPAQVNTTGAAAASGFGPNGDLQREAQSRQRGALQSHRFEGAARGGFAGGPAERGGGFG